MSPLSLAECLGRDEFLTKTMHRTYRHVPDAIEEPAELMSWDALNAILATHRLVQPRLRLSADGEVISQDRYASPITARRQVAWQRINPAQLSALLAEGASLVLDAVDELHPPVSQAASELERWLRTSIQANLYASWTAREGFGLHWDDHDVLVVQIYGLKRWKLYGQTRFAPTYKDTEQPEPPGGGPVANLVLRQGDLLYLPRGWWHSVSASEGEPSLHITFAMQPVTGATLLYWLADEIGSREALRMDLPVHAPEASQKAYLDLFRSEVTTALADPGLIARYIAARDAAEVTRLWPSLPHITCVPPDPAVRIRLTSSRARIESADEGILFLACNTKCNLPDRTRPMLDLLIAAMPRPVRLGELAAASNLTLDEAAAVATHLLAGQGVTAEGP